MAAPEEINLGVIGAGSIAVACLREAGAPESAFRVRALCALERTRSIGRRSGSASPGRPGTTRSCWRGRTWTPSPSTPRTPCTSR